jgi:hypothetical protein
MIRQIVENRRIERLVHFTRLENLIGILRFGLIPRLMLDQWNIPYIVNDFERNDSCLNANCLSVSFPNYQLFFRQQKRTPQTVWVVLAIHPQVLWQKASAFCAENAASSSVRAIPLALRQTGQAFQKLFHDAPNGVRRSDFPIPYHYTTNPQAEVLVFDTIEPVNIMEVYYRGLDWQHIRPIQRWAPGIRYTRSEEVFGPRSDYRFWRKTTGRQPLMEVAHG